MSEPLDEMEERDTASITDVYLLGPRPTPAFRQLVLRVHRQFVEVNRRLACATRKFQDIKTEVDGLGDVALTITVVPALTDLPANAEPTQWYRVVADPAAVYVGNGMTRPLSRFTTTPV